MLQQINNYLWNIDNSLGNVDYHLGNINNHLGNVDDHLYNLVNDIWVVAAQTANLRITALNRSQGRDDLELL
jgi:archaellum component FlaC